MKTTSILLGLVLLCATLYAASSTVTPPQGNFSGTLMVQKTAPNSASLDETITITITIQNSGSSAVEAYVEEGLGNAAPVGVTPTYANIEGDFYAARSPYLSWTVNIAAGQTQTITYQIRPNTVGPLGIGPTSVWVGNKVFYSNSLEIDVACSASPSCDESIGETPLTCPSKCAGANATGETAPTFQPVPTSPPPITILNESTGMQEVADEEKRMNDEKNSQLYMFLGVVAIIIIAAAAAYWVFRKKAPAPARPGR